MAKYIILIVCAVFTSCSPGSGLSSLADFEQRLGGIILTRDASALLSLFIPSKALKNIDVILTMPFRFAYDPRDVRSSIVEKAMFHRKILSTEGDSVASQLPASGVYPVRYDVHRSGQVLVACIRFGGGHSPADAVEFVAIHQDGKWHLLTVNVDEAAEK